jgi:hypothetical protein
MAIACEVHVCLLSRPLVTFGANASAECMDKDKTSDTQGTRPSQARVSLLTGIFCSHPHPTKCYPARAAGRVMGQPTPR